MKKIKSLFAILALGGLTLSGCSAEDLMFWKKKSEEQQQQEENKDQQGGEQQQGGSQQGGEQGGSQQGGGSQGGGEQGGGSQGGGEQGGGQTTGPRFVGKKFEVQSLTTNPVEYQEEAVKEYGNAYISLLEYYGRAEMIMPYEVQVDENTKKEVFDGMFGSYVVNEEDTTATITANQMYSGEMDLTFDADQGEEQTYVINFDAEKSEYSTVIVSIDDNDTDNDETDDVEVTMTIILKVSEEAATTVGTQAPFISHTTDNVWIREHMVMDENEVMQFDIAINLEKDEEFVIKYGMGMWAYYENYQHNLDTAYGKVVQGSPISDEQNAPHSFKVTEAGLYNIYAKLAMTLQGMDVNVYIVKGDPTNISYLGAFRLLGVNGDWATGIEGVDDTKAEEVANHDYVEQRKFTFEAVANEEIKLNDGNVENWLGFDQLEAGCQALATKVTEEGDSYNNIKIKEAGTYTLYLKLLEDNSLSMWLAKEDAGGQGGGGEQGGGEQQNTTTMTFICEDTMFENGAKLHVHYWGEGTELPIKDVVLTADNLSVTFEEGYTHFIIVRSPAESYADIIFSGEGDNCWGQTGNVAIQAGTFNLAYSGNGEELVVTPANNA